MEGLGRADRREEQASQLAPIESEKEMYIGSVALDVID